MRTCKTGLDYFPFDIDFFEDPKVEFITARFGIIGENVSIKLLTRIYRNGYFLKWGEDEALLFTKRLIIEATCETISSIVKELLKRGFFSQQHFDKYSVLTSNGIQKRFLEATCRRKCVEMFKELIIADIEGYNVNIIPLDSNIGTQRKGKERKGKEKGNGQSVTIPDFINEETWKEYLKMRNRIGKPATEHAKELAI
ncbi:MAG TPA: DUF4373 domain-containing protein, partial [Syntrophales bacterium]|nr:DUF4373 domain-containing protein [Syntrophales bacterium]